MEEKQSLTTNLINNYVPAQEEQEPADRKYKVKTSYIDGTSKRKLIKYQYKNHLMMATTNTNNQNQHLN